MSWKEMIETLKVGGVLNFTEYTINRRGRKLPTVSIEGGVITEVLQANSQVPRETLEKYYGNHLADEDYLQLSCMNCPRVVVSLGMNGNGEVDIKVLVLNQDFYNMELQHIEVINSVSTSDSPNYFMAMNAWQ